MSNFVKDIANMHSKFNVNEVIRGLDQEKLRWFLEFRARFLQEELDELQKALSDFDAFQIDGAKAADDTVDALIDLIVVAIGTLDAFDIDSVKAWNRVHEKNMQKEVGVKESRPNPLGLPDLVKSKDWTPPCHRDNLGLLEEVFKRKGS